MDQAALRAAVAAGLPTGGWAPLDWMTETADGKRHVAAPWLADYGLVQCTEPGYSVRTTRNVESADGVLLLGDRNTAGSKRLIQDCRRLGKPFMWVQNGFTRPSEVVAWVRGCRPAVLLVAGNRESSAPGIGSRAEKFLTVVFRALARTEGG